MRISGTPGIEYDLFEPRRDQFKSNLAGAMEYMWATILYKVITIMGKGFAMFLGSVGAAFLDHLHPEIKREVSPLIQMYRDTPGIDPKTDKFLKDLQESEGEATVITLLLSLGSFLLGELLPATASLTAPITYGANAKVRQARPSPSELWPMYWRQVISEETLRDWMADQGYPDDAQAGYAQLMRRRLDEGDLVRWAFMTDKDPEVVRIELRRRGWKDENISQLLKITKTVPGPGDQVTFALREAWRDDIAAKFQYDAERPAEFDKWMSRLGYEDVWARNYWRAHWDVPGPRLGMRMLRRQVITPAEFDTLLKIADYPPFWRNAITGVAYRPYTRVDVRRMHLMGVLSDDELVKAYKDFGYDDKRAEAMALFTMRYNARHDIDYTKGEVLKAYRLRALNASEAVSALGELGITETVAKFLIGLEDYKRIEKLKRARIDNIEDAFIQGDLDENRARGQLAELNLRGNEIDVLIEEWVLSRQKKIARASKADVRKFYFEGIIDRDQVRHELAKRRVPDYLTGWYIALWDEALVQRQAAEVEREEKEQQRVAKSGFKTHRREAIQKINVAIARQKGIIAQAKMALSQVKPPAEIAALERKVDDIKVAIANKRVDIEQNEAAIENLSEMIRRIPAPKMAVEAHERVEAIQEEIDGVRLAIEENEDEIAELKIQALEVPYPPRIAEINERINELKLTNEHYETEIAALRLLMGKLKHTLTTTPTAEMIEGLRREVATAHSEIKDIDVDIAEEKAEMAEAKRGLLEVKTPAEIAVLKRKIEDIKVAIANKRVSKEQTQAAIETLREMIRRVPPAKLEAQLNERVEATQDEINEIRVAIEENEDTIAELKTEALEVRYRPRIAKINDRINELKLTNEKLETRITRLRLVKGKIKHALTITREEEMVEGLRREVATAQSDIKSTEVDISEERAEMVQIKARLRELPKAQQVREIREKIATAKTEIARLRLKRAMVPVTM